MLRIGLTGGIASGKSTVAAMFVELGAALVDTDVIAREVVAPGEPGLAAVREAFGESVITAAGELDRAALRKRVFRDAAERRRLDEILHPLIRRRTLDRLKEIRAPYVIVAVPLLVETGFGEIVDRVLVVDCPRHLQRERLLTRPGIEPEEADAMLSAQVDRATRLAAADDVIDNSGTLEQTRDQVKRLHRRYERMAKFAE